MSTETKPIPAVVTPRFQIGETVYSAISSDDRGMVTGVLQRGFVYLITWADSVSQESEHSEIELSREPVFMTPTR